MKKYRGRSLGVDWHLPDGKGGFRKRPFATTTVASSNLIAIIAEAHWTRETGGPTWARMVDLIHHDPEAKAIAERFVAEGFGDRLVLNHIEAGA